MDPQPWHPLLERRKTNRNRIVIGQGSEHDPSNLLPVAPTSNQLQRSHRQPHGQERRLMKQTGKMTVAKGQGQVLRFFVRGSHGELPTGFDQGLQFGHRQRTSSMSPLKN